ncbi:CACNA1E [Symbiodinium sp. CCMP2592]|nr:CACNA1E [Symbiodinium sp. CCMP2592]
MDHFLSWPGKGSGAEESQKKEAEDTVFASITDVSARQPPANSSQVATQLSWMGQQKRLSSRQQKLHHTLRQLQSMRYKMNDEAKPWMDSDGLILWSKWRIRAARVVLSQAFESCMGLVILINFGFIVFESDRDSKCYPDYAGRYDACPQRSELLEWLRLVNLTLLSVYTLEALCRAFVERSQYFCNRWNVVDLLAVLLGWPTVLSLGSGNLHLLRMVRFVRLIRALRVIISVPELYLLVTGFSSSIKAIIFGSLLLVAALVFWAVIAVEVLHPIISVLPYPDCGNCSAGFSGIFAATVTLFQQMVMGDAWGAISLPLIEAAPWTFPVLFVMMMTVSLGAMNLILAVIVERAAQGRDKDQERKIKQKEEERSKNMIDLAVLCATMDEDNSGSLSLVEMLHGYDRNEEFRKLMQVMDIKRDDMQTIFRVLDSDDSGEVSYFEFCQHLGSFLERDPVVMHSLVKRASRFRDC